HVVSRLSSGGRSERSAAAPYTANHTRSGAARPPRRRDAARGDVGHTIDRRCHSLQYWSQHTPREEHEMLARVIGRVALAAALAGGGLVVTQSPAEAATSAQRAAIIKEVKRHIGKGYRYGAAGPSRFDCSGLVKYVVYRSVRKGLPHDANAQKN